MNTLLSAVRAATLHGAIALGALALVVLAQTVITSLDDVAVDGDTLSAEWVNEVNTLDERIEENEADIQASSSEINTLSTRMDALEASQGNSSGLPAADYDSGWFYVKKNTDYNKTHNLGRQPSLAIIWQASDSRGKGMSIMDGIYSSKGFGSWLQKITSTKYQLSTGYYSAGSGYGKTSHWLFNTKNSGSNRGSTYLRVLMWK